MKKLMLFVLSLCTVMGMQAQVKKISVIPDNATIFYKGQEVGNGYYEVKFARGEEFVMLRFEAPGYIPRTVKVFKNNPNRAISFTLTEDEAISNSAESIIANRRIDVPVRSGMTTEMIWKRMVSIALDNFENVETRDKEAGWIRTAWTYTRFQYVTVRTRLEIRQAMGTDELTYKVQIDSEIAYGEGNYEQGFKPFNRLLKKYDRVITDLQTTLGSNL